MTRRTSRKRDPSAPFMLSNYQFVLPAGVVARRPDLLKSADDQQMSELWPQVEVVLCHETHDYNCPICLDFPSAARVGLCFEGRALSGGRKRQWGVRSPRVGGGGVGPGNSAGACRITEAPLAGDGGLRVWARVLLNNSASPGGGGLGGGLTPPSHPLQTPPTPPPRPPLSDWANFSPGLRPMKNFLWRLQRKSGWAETFLRRL